MSMIAEIDAASGPTPREIQFAALRAAWNSLPLTATAQQIVEAAQQWECLIRKHLKGHLS